MKIILINLFAPFTGSKYTSGVIHFEPLGLEYVGAAIKESGYNVKIMSPDPSENIEKFGSRIAQECPDIIGIGPATYNFNQAKALSGIIKTIHKDTFTIFGSYHVTAVPHEVSDPVIDLAIQGEGEHTSVEVLDCLRKGDSYESIQGISYLKNGNVVVNPRRERIRNLDSMPFPLRNKKDMGIYKCKGVFKPATSKQHSVAQVTYSRGCPNNCSYCSSKNMWGRDIIYRNPYKMTEELEYLIDNFGTNLFYFSDLTFNADKKRVIEVCEAIIKRNIKVNWFCGCRPEGIDEELINIMKKSGCSRIHFGIEAIDEYSLEKIYRKKTYGYTEKALEIASRAGIITRAYLMIGYPWETREHLESINTNLNRLYIDDLRISFFTPFPGTAVYNKTRNKIVTDNWDDFTTDKPMYRIEGLNESEILNIRDMIFLNYYQSSDYAKRLEEKLSTYPELNGSFEEFFKEINLSVYIMQENNI